MRWRIYLSLVLLLLVLTFVVQNTNAVSLNFLFWTFDLPRALLLLVAFLAGTAAGLLLVASRHQRSRSRKTDKDQKEMNQPAS